MRKATLDEVVRVTRRISASSTVKPPWFEVEPGTYVIADVTSDPADKGSEVVVLRPVDGGPDLPPLVTRTSHGQTALGDLIWGE